MTVFLLGVIAGLLLGQGSKAVYRRAWRHYEECLSERCRKCKAARVVLRIP